MVMRLQGLAPASSGAATPRAACRPLPLPALLPVAAAAWPAAQIASSLHQ